MKSILGAIIQCYSLAEGGVNLDYMMEQFEEDVINGCHESITKNFESIVQYQNDEVEELYDYDLFIEELKKNGGYFIRMVEPSTRYGAFLNAWSATASTWAWVHRLEDAESIMRKWSETGDAVRTYDTTDTDYLFITEVMNDLHRHGFSQGGKAHAMLRDWKNELGRRTSFPKTKQRKVHAKTVGKENW